MVCQIGRLDQAEGGDKNPTTTERKLSIAPVSNDDLKEQLKPSVVSGRAAASATSIHDIPKELLLEILCRLPCAKSVFRCKSVSKSWLSLTSDPYFIGRFLWLRRQSQTLIPRTILDSWRDEVLSTDLFATFRSANKSKLEVIAACNDLVLCRDNKGRYHICNPRTNVTVSLPPMNSFNLFPVGFICEPYYKEEQEDDDDDQKQEEKGKVIKIEPEYKFKVVMILPHPRSCRPCFEFKIRVFSSDVGEWKESLVSCPRGFDFRDLQSDCESLASNGMLYWTGEEGQLLGLGPSMINISSSTANGDSGYQFHVIKFGWQIRPHETHLHLSARHLQTHHRDGSLQVVELVGNLNCIGASLYVWEVEKQELEQMAVQGGGELGERHRKIYPIMNGVQYTWLGYLFPDPNDLATCFVSRINANKKRDGHEKEEDDDDRYEVIYKCNMNTGECSKTEMVNRKIYCRGFDMEMDENLYARALQIKLPWWPTPAPTIRSCKGRDPQ